jgi:hypothetical protein
VLPIRHRSDFSATCRRWRLALLAVAAILAFAFPAHTATIRATDQCTEISGQIVEGDAKRLAEAMGDDFGGLCLNSPGGSYVEALAIIKKMQSMHTVMTRVRAGDQCLSACAIIFMFGKEGQSSGAEPARFLEAGGALGFHSPAVDATFVGKVQADRQSIVAAYDAAMISIFELLRLAADKVQYRSRTRVEPWMSFGLVERMLGTPANSMYYIDDVGKATAWGIQVDRTRWEQEANGGKTFAWTAARLRNACMNHFFKLRGYLSVADTSIVHSELRMSSEKSEISQGRVKYIGKFMDRGESPLCEVEWQDPTSRGGVACIADGSNERSCFHPEPWQGEPAPTKLSSIAAVEVTATSQAKLDLALLKDHHIAGVDLLVKRGSTESICRDACGSMPRCGAYVFDAWNFFCFLKSEIGEATQDPKYQSGYDTNKGVPSFSAAPNDIQKYRGKLMQGASTTTAGSTLEYCEGFCSIDPKCLAYSWMRPNNSCAHFQSVTGYSTDKAVESGVKRQQSKVP